MKKKIIITILIIIFLFLTSVIVFNLFKEVDSTDEEYILKTIKSDILSTEIQYNDLMFSDLYAFEVDKGVYELGFSVSNELDNDLNNLQFMIRVYDIDNNVLSYAAVTIDKLKAKEKLGVNSTITGDLENIHHYEVVDFSEGD